MNTNRIFGWPSAIGSECPYSRNKGGAQNLELAYAMNVFSDHFLEDSFAAGHIRVPREILHGGKLRPEKDLCAKVSFLFGYLRVSNTR